MRKLLFFAVYAAGLLYLLPTKAGVLETYFGCKPGNVCVIRAPVSHGGNVEIFEKAAEEVLATKTRVRIPANCDSACVLFATLARPYVCIMQTTSFGFHKFVKYRKNKGVEDSPPTVFGARYIQWLNNNGFIRQYVFDPDYPPEVKKWLRERGGTKEGTMLYMTYKYARHIWLPCRNQESPGR